jgi:hypothetical protein
MSKSCEVCKDLGFKCKEQPETNYRLLIPIADKTSAGIVMFYSLEDCRRRRAWMNYHEKHHEK